MNQKKVRGRKIRWIAMIVVSAVLCFFASFAFAEEEALQNRPLDSKQILLAGSMAPDYPGIDSPRPMVVEEVKKKEPAWSVGAGVGMVPDYEGSEDYKGVPLLFARAGWNSGQYVQFFGNMLKANLIAGNRWSVGPLARYRGKRDDDVDNNKVKRMREVDEAIELGGFVGYMIDNWHVSFFVAQDVNDAHDGLVATLEAGYTMNLNPGVNLGISAFTSYASDDYMETYFGVDAENANRSGLSRYEADGGIKDLGVVANLAYAPWKNWGVTGMLGLKWLLGDAADSPVVDDEGSETQLFSGVMATYRF
jgi:outer membrane protein